MKQIFVSLKISMRPLWISLVLLAVVALLLPACDKEENATQKVTQKTDKTPPAVQGTPTPEKISAPKVSDETRQTYQWYCSQCHGLKGKGDGINAKFLTVPPRAHTKADYLETRSNQQLFDAIKQGGLAVGRAPCMPRWGHTLSEATIHSLVAYIRELCECEAL
jgi:cytochrome c oxidase cbb3-type subunit 3